MYIHQLVTSRKKYTWSQQIVTIVQLKLTEQYADVIYERMFYEVVYSLVILLTSISFNDRFHTQWQYARKNSLLFAIHWFMWSEV